MIHGGENGSDTERVISMEKQPRRFYYVGYPPCTLSFTWSENLAIHMRYETPSYISLHMLIMSENKPANYLFNAIPGVDSTDSPFYNGTHERPYQ
jgi:hypothetical protein